MGCRRREGAGGICRYKPLSHGEHAFRINQSRIDVDDRDRPWEAYASGRTGKVWRDDHERKRWERDELERQRDEDRSDFYRYFRPNDDLSTITGPHNLSTVRAFLTDILPFYISTIPKPTKTSGARYAIWYATANLCHT